MTTESNIDAEMRFSRQKGAQDLWIQVFDNCISRISNQLQAADIKHAGDLADQALAKFKTVSF